eukprot:TRINITY_DN6482_c0_g1_i1.p1 TRINITY_DN6482_c0_g1~~TRINITY_DN6482_c0_g1_i1.p1  ORF type:complete len:694 (-),score=193.85 TRINITY_DN6482_c0_g1_i1:26-2107(-)
MNKKTNQLEKFLINKPWMLNFIFDTVQTQEGNFGASLFYLYHMNECEDIIIDYSADFLLKFGGMEYIRGNYPGTFVFVEYAKIYSFFYIKKVLAQIIEKYLKENVTYTNLSINQSLDEEQIVFSRFTKDILESILNSSDHLPGEVLNMMGYLTDKLNHKSPGNDNQFIVVSTIFFLRVLTPCIIDPIKSEMISKEMNISNESKKALLYVAKIIQSIVNNAKLEEENTLSGWIQYFGEYREKIVGFVNKIMKNENQKKYPPIQVSKSQLSDHSKVLFENINKAAETILEKMKDCTSVNTYDVIPSVYVERFTRIVNKTRKEFGIKETISNSSKSRNSKKITDLSLDFLPEMIVFKYKLVMDGNTKFNAVSLPREGRLKDLLEKLVERHQIKQKERMEITYHQNDMEYFINSEESFTNFIYFTGKALLKNHKIEIENLQNETQENKEILSRFDVAIFDNLSIEIFSKKDKHLNELNIKNFPKSPSVFETKTKSEGFKTFTERVTKNIESNSETFDKLFQSDDKLFLFNSDDSILSSQRSRRMSFGGKKGVKTPSTNDLKKSSKLGFFFSDKKKKKNKETDSPTKPTKKVSSGKLDRKIQLDTISDFEEQTSFTEDSNQESMSPRELSLFEFLKMSSSVDEGDDDSDVDKAIHKVSNLSILGKKSYTLNLDMENEENNNGNNTNGVSEENLEKKEN